MGPNPFSLGIVPGNECSIPDGMDACCPNRILAGTDTEPLTLGYTLSKN